MRDDEVIEDRDIAKRLHYLMSKPSPSGRYRHTVGDRAFVAGRWSTTSWPIVADACVEYSKARAEFVKAEREFEAKHSPYKYQVHAAVFRNFEPPSAYLAGVDRRAPRRVCSAPR